MRARQQHTRFDLGESRRHEQILARQLQLQHLHQLDVAHVLQGDLGDRNVEHIQILAADQVEQHVERPLEGLEEHSSACGGIYRSRGISVTGWPSTMANGISPCSGGSATANRRRIVRHQRQFRLHR